MGLNKMAFPIALAGPDKSAAGAPSSTSPLVMGFAPYFRNNRSWGWFHVGAFLLFGKMAAAVYGHWRVQDFDEGFDNKERPYFTKAWFPRGCGQNWALGCTWQCGFAGAGYYLLAYGV